MWDVNLLSSILTAVLDAWLWVDFLRSSSWCCHSSVRGDARVEPPSWVIGKSEGWLCLQNYSCVSDFGLTGLSGMPHWLFSIHYVEQLGKNKFIFPTVRLRDFTILFSLIWPTPLFDAAFLHGCEKWAHLLGKGLSWGLMGHWSHLQRRLGVTCEYWWENDLNSDTWEMVFQSGHMLFFILLLKLKFQECWILKYYK